MIECASCGTSRYLNIVESEVRALNGCVIEVREEYQCVSCGGAGELRSDYHSTTVRGSVRDNKERPGVWP